MCSHSGSPSGSEIRFLSPTPSASQLSGCWTVKHFPSALDWGAEHKHIIFVSLITLRSAALRPRVGCWWRHSILQLPTPSSDVGTKLRNDVVVFINYPSAINNVIALSVFQSSSLPIYAFRFFLSVFGSGLMFSDFCLFLRKIQISWLWIAWMGYLPFPNQSPPGGQAVGRCSVAARWARTV